MFWRSASDGTLHSDTLPGLGNAYVDLRENPAWGGRISELGLVFYDDGGKILLKSLTAETASLSGLLRATLAQWRWQTWWTQKSVHWIGIDKKTTIVPLALFVLVWISLCGLICIFLCKKHGTTKIWAALVLVGWLVLDARWILNRVAQASVTITDYPAARTTALKFGDDGATQRAVLKATCDIGPPSPLSSERLVIATDSRQDMRFQMLRGKYHALPVPAHVYEGEFDRLPANLADRVLMLKQRYSAEGEGNKINSSEAVRLLQKRGHPARLGWEDNDAYLILLGETTSQSDCGIKE